MEPSSEGGKPTEDEQVCQIASTFRVLDFFDKGFRYGISKSSFHLILKAIMLNPHNLLLWETRRWLLQAYGRSRKLELEYFREITKDGAAGAFLRTYTEMWFHRFWLAKAIGAEAIKQEFDSIKNILRAKPDESDMWTILLYVVEEVFPPPDLGDEFKFVNRFLVLHPMELGAWLYRDFLVLSLDKNKLKALKFTKSFLLSNVNNGHAWAHRMTIVRTLDTNEKYKELELMKNFSRKHVHITSKNFWDHRQAIAKSFPADLLTVVVDMELQFSHELLLLDMKNRYAWLHRRWVFKNLGTTNKEDEFKLTSDFIKMDVNNSFAWFHRKWLIKEFGGSEDELEFCNVILQIDVHCVSSWHQRAFVILECTSNLCDKMRDAEVKYAIRAIFRNPENKQPWKYLMLLYMKCDYYDSIIDKAYFSLLFQITNVISDIKDKRNLVVNVLGTLLELLCRGYQPSHCMGDMIAELCSKAPGMIVSLGSEDSFCEFINSITSLLKYVDPMNDHFWEILKSEVKGYYASMP